MEEQDERESMVRAHIGRVIVERAAVCVRESFSVHAPQRIIMKSVKNKRRTKTKPRKSAPIGVLSSQHAPLSSFKRCLTCGEEFIGKADRAGSLLLLYCEKCRTDGSTDQNSV